MAGTEEMLAQYEGLGSITVCGCGTLSLHVGGVSLRLDATAFAQVVVMMNHAVAQLQSRERSLEEQVPEPASVMTH